MAANLHIEMKFDKKWEDNFSIIVYENEICKEYNRAGFSNLYASKKELIRKISLLEDITPEMIFILENITDITGFEIILDTHALIILTNSSKITTDILKPLYRIFSDLQWPKKFGQIISNNLSEFVICNNSKYY